jgi:hypothetical protein
MTMPISSTRIRRLVAVASLAVFCTGCAAAERGHVMETEHLLSAAGFERRPADTAAKQAQLAALPPHELMAQPLPPDSQDTVGYVYADPEDCRCLFVGDAAAYQAYREMEFEQRLSEQRVLAASLYEDAPFEWSLWGPGFWHPGDVTVRPERP